MSDLQRYDDFLVEKEKSDPKEALISTAERNLFIKAIEGLVVFGIFSSLPPALSSRLIGRLRHLFTGFCKVNCRSFTAKFQPTSFYECLCKVLGRTSHSVIAVLFLEYYCVDLIAFAIIFKSKYEDYRLLNILASKTPLASYLQSILSLLLIIKPDFCSSSQSALDFNRLLSTYLTRVIFEYPLGLHFLIESYFSLKTPDEDTNRKVQEIASNLLCKPSWVTSKADYYLMLIKSISVSLKKLLDPCNPPSTLLVIYRQIFGIILGNIYSQNSKFIMVEFLSEPLSALSEFSNICNSNDLHDEATFQHFCSCVQNLDTLTVDLFLPWIRFLVPLVSVNCDEAAVQFLMDATLPSALFLKRYRDITHVWLELLDNSRRDLLVATIYRQIFFDLDLLKEELSNKKAGNLTESSFVTSKFDNLPTVLLSPLFLMIFKDISRTSSDDSSLGESSEMSGNRMRNVMHLLDELLPIFETYLSGESSVVDISTIEFLVDFYGELGTKDDANIRSVIPTIVHLMLPHIKISSVNAAKYFVLCGKVDVFLASLPYHETNLKKLISEQLDSLTQLCQPEFSSSPLLPFVGQIQDVREKEAPEIGAFFIELSGFLEKNSLTLKGDPLLTVMSDSIFSLVGHEDSYVYLNVIKVMERLAILGPESVLRRYLLMLEKGLTLLKPIVLERLVQVLVQFVRNSGVKTMHEYGPSMIITSLRSAIFDALRLHSSIFSIDEDTQGNGVVEFNWSQVESYQYQSSLLSCMSYICESYALLLYSHDTLSFILTLSLQILEFLSLSSLSEAGHKDEAIVAVRRELHRAALVVPLNVLKGLSGHTLELVAKNPDEMRPLLDVYRHCKALCNGLTLTHDDDDVLLHHARCFLESVDSIVRSSLFLEI